MGTNLGDNMIARANADNLPEAHKLRELGAAFNKAARDFYGEPQRITVKQFMGHWARARRCWSEYTGKSLVPLMGSV